jgi:hypothetical protein
LLLVLSTMSIEKNSYPTEGDQNLIIPLSGTMKRIYPTQMSGISVIYPTA